MYMSMLEHWKARLLYKQKTKNKTTRLRSAHTGPEYAMPLLRSSSCTSISSGCSLGECALVDNTTGCRYMRCHYTTDSAAQSPLQGSKTDVQHSQRNAATAISITDPRQSRWRGIAARHGKRRPVDHRLKAGSDVRHSQRTTRQARRTAPRVDDQHSRIQRPQRHPSTMARVCSQRSLLRFPPVRLLGSLCSYLLGGELPVVLTYSSGRSSSSRSPPQQIVRQFQCSKLPGTAAITPQACLVLAHSAAMRDYLNIPGLIRGWFAGRLWVAHLWAGRKCCLLHLACRCTAVADLECSWLVLMQAISQGCRGANGTGRCDHGLKRAALS
jgi:hypothetical protein